MVAMRNLGMEEMLVKLVQSMYNNVRSFVGLEMGIGRNLGILCECIKAHAVLSPLLFFMVLDSLF